MSALEAFSTGTPTVLRDLDLYRAIIDGYYLPAKDKADMQQELATLATDSDLRQRLSEQALAASERYSADYVAGIWQKFYTEQAALGKR